MIYDGDPQHTQRQLCSDNKQLQSRYVQESRTGEGGREIEVDRVSIIGTYVRKSDTFQPMR
jgi:hypothetical protein